MSKCPECSHELQYLVARCIATVIPDPLLLKKGKITLENPHNYYCPFCNKRIAVTENFAVKILTA